MTLTPTELSVLARLGVPENALKENNMTETTEDLIDRAVDAGMDLIAWSLFEDERVPEDAETAVRGALAHLLTALTTPEPDWEYARQNRYGYVCAPDDSREQAEYRAALGGSYDTVVRALRQVWEPLQAADVAPAPEAPELFPGTTDALDALTIRKGK